MTLKKIVLNNFQIFQGYNEFFFTKLNAIEGNNGSGKSTLIKDSIRFCLYGLSDKTIAELKSKNADTNECFVEIELKHKDNTYIIKRLIPSKLSIIKNDIPLIYETIPEAQKYINDIFGTYENLKRFRLIDIKESTAILEEGKTSLKKILLSFHESKFTKLRERLQNKKYLYETYNKDKVVTYKLYPSEKRLNFLQDKALELSSKISGLTEEYDKVSSYNLKLNNRKAEKESQKKIHGGLKNKIISANICPTCQQTISSKYKDEALAEYNLKIEQANIDIAHLNEEIEEQKEILTQIKKNINNFTFKLDSIKILILKLTTRLKQKEFIYSNKDIAIIKKSIEYLDKFYSNYISFWLSNLEPIINSVIESIGLKVNFVLNKTGNLDIVLSTPSNTYKYTELSTGQRLILNIALQLTLLLEKNEDGLIIADEGFSSLDETNLTHIFKLFNNLPFQLVSVVHRFSYPGDINLIKLERK